METTYYTLTAREIVVEGAEVQQACGGSGRRLVCVRKAPETRPAEPAGKVIDLAAWRADREAEPFQGWADEPEWEEDRSHPAPETRKNGARRGVKAALGLEILASLSVVTVALVLLAQAIGMF